MMNQVFLVGKVKEIVRVDEFQNNLFLEIERPFKDGYSRIFDVIECSYWNSLFQKVVGSSKKGDLVALRGRIENINNKFLVMIENIVLLNKCKDNVLKTL